MQAAINLQPAPTLPEWLTLAEAADLISQRSPVRVSPRRLAARRGSVWCFAPEVRRFQLKSGCAITVCREDLEVWIGEQLRKVERPPVVHSLAPGEEARARWASLTVGHPRLQRALQREGVL